MVRFYAKCVSGKPCVTESTVTEQYIKVMQFVKFLIGALRTKNKLKTLN